MSVYAGVAHHAREMVLYMSGVSVKSGEVVLYLAGVECENWRGGPIYATYRLNSMHHRTRWMYFQPVCACVLACACMLCVCACVHSHDGGFMPNKNVYRVQRAEKAENEP